jgi:ABC-type nitrate/sulfonate/bicarbonate transport system permease component
LKTSSSEASAVELSELSPPLTHIHISRRAPWWIRLDGPAHAVLLFVEFVAIVLLWQLSVVVLELVNPIFLPSPTSIAEGFKELVVSGEIWPHLSLSLKGWVTGYALAVVAGIVIGTLVGTSLPVHRLTSPLLWSFYSIPWLAYRPLTVAWFGFGLAPIVFLVFIASLFPILFNTAAGVGETEESLLNAGKVFGSNRFSIYRKIVLPSALPYVFAGMRQSVVLATIALLVAEMTGSTIGVGALITIKTNSFATQEAYAAIVIAIVWTVSVSHAVKILGKRVAPWQFDVREN